MTANIKPVKATIRYQFNADFKTVGNSLCQDAQGNFYLANVELAGPGAPRVTPGGEVMLTGTSAEPVPLATALDWFCSGWRHAKDANGKIEPLLWEAAKRLREAADLLGHVATFNERVFLTAAIQTGHV